MKTNEQYIQEVRHIHGDRYGYDRIQYQGKANNIEVYCKRCEKYIIMPANTFLRGNGCRKCAKTNSGLKRRTNTEKYLQKIQVRDKDNLFDYSNVTYKDQKTKIQLRCNQCSHEFLRYPFAHLQQLNNCPECNRRAMRSTKKEFIIKAQSIHGHHKYDYSNVQYETARQKIVIICRIHGEFTQTPNTHLRGSGCHKCSGKLVMDTRSFVEASKKIHGEKFDYSKVQYASTNKKIIIVCGIHGDFEQTPNNHLQGQGCDKCARGMWLFSSDEFRQEAKKIHGDRYDYTHSIYEKMTIPLSIYCRQHEYTFKQSPSNHITHKQGCPICGKIKRAESRAHDFQDFLDRAQQLHGDHYSYDKTRLIPYTRGHSTKIVVTCRIHERDIWMYAQAHLHGKGGCWDCHKTRLREQRAFTNEQFIERCHSTFGRTNFDYSLVKYINNSVHVEVICLKKDSKGILHGRYWVCPSYHLQSDNGGCRKCTQIGYSKAQIEYLEFMSSYLGTPIQHALNGGEFRISKTSYRVDGFVYPDKIFEFHGDFYHGNPDRYDPNDFNPVCKQTFGDLYIKTLRKEKELRELGYDLHIIWESTWNGAKHLITQIQRNFRKYRANLTDQMIK